MHTHTWSNQVTLCCQENVLCQENERHILIILYTHTRIWSIQPSNVTSHWIKKAAQEGHIIVMEIIMHSQLYNHNELYKIQLIGSDAALHYITNFLDVIPYITTPLSPALRKCCTISAIMAEFLDQPGRNKLGVKRLIRYKVCPHCNHEINLKKFIKNTESCTTM